MKFKSTILIIILPIIMFSQTGYVVDTETNSPISGSEVYFIDLNQTTVTDDMGAFQLPVIGTHHLTISIEAKEYEPRIFEINLVKDSNYTFRLKEGHIKLDEITVSVGSETQYSSITNVTRSKIDDLASTGSSTLGEMLSSLPGVSNASLGQGIFKPIIRGLSNARVVTYLNSLRIENQQWGNDHGMGPNEIGIGAVEIIKGPASLLYGSDAIGGVIFLQDEPYVGSHQIRTYVQSRFESSTLGTSNAGGVKIAGDRLRFNFDYGYQNFADYKIPNGQYVKNTRYNGQTFKGALGYSTKKWISNLRVFSTNNALGLPGHTHDIIPNTDDFYSSDQKRNYTVPAQKINNHFIGWENKIYLNKSRLQFDIGLTQNELREFEEKITLPAIDLKLTNYVANLKFIHRFNKSHSLTVGSQGMHKTNTNEPKAEEIILPNLTSIDAGIYGVYSYKLEKMVFQAGIRNDWRHIQTNGLDQIYSGTNYSLGGKYHNRKLTISANISSGTRAPNVSELLANGLHHGSNRFEIGDTQLTTEKAHQLDVSFNWKNEQVELLINPYVSKIFDFISLQPINEFIDLYPVYQYIQTTSTYLYGTDFYVHYHPKDLEQLHLAVNGTFIYTDNGNGNSDISFFPQNNVTGNIGWDMMPHNHKLKAKLVTSLSYYLQQDQVTTYETPTPDFFLWNASLNFEFTNDLSPQLSVGINNITNENYTPHTSNLKSLGIPNPGRNIFIKLKMNLTKSLNNNHK